MFITRSTDSETTFLIADSYCLNPLYIFAIDISPRCLCRESFQKICGRRGKSERHFKNVKIGKVGQKGLIAILLSQGTK